MPQLHINHVRNQVEIEYHLNMFISAFRTDAAGDPEFTYEDLLGYFLHFQLVPGLLLSSVRTGEGFK